MTEGDRRKWNNLWVERPFQLFPKYPRVKLMFIRCDHLNWFSIQLPKDSSRWTDKNIFEVGTCSSHWVTGAFTMTGNFNITKGPTFLKTSSFKVSFLTHVSILSQWNYTNNAMPFSEPRGLLCRMTSANKRLLEWTFVSRNLEGNLVVSSSLRMNEWSNE